MTDEEFIVKANDILERHGCQFAEVCDDKVTLLLGDFSYMNRQQLVEAAKEVLILEGYPIEDIRGVTLKEVNIGGENGKTKT